MFLVKVYFSKGNSSNSRDREKKMCVYSKKWFQLNLFREECCDSMWIVLADNTLSASSATFYFSVYLGFTEFRCQVMGISMALEC